MISTMVVLTTLGATSLLGRRAGLMVFLGDTLFILGLYFFPLGALEAYTGTKKLLGLTDAQNAILWYGITTLLIVAGQILLATLIAPITGHVLRALGVYFFPLGAIEVYAATQAAFGSYALAAIFLYGITLAAMAAGLFIAGRNPQKTLRDARRSTA